MNPVLERLALLRVGPHMCRSAQVKRELRAVVPAHVKWGAQAGAVFQALAGDFMADAVAVVDQLLAAGVAKRRSQPSWLDMCRTNPEYLQHSSNSVSIESRVGCSARKRSAQHSLLNQGFLSLAAVGRRLRYCQQCCSAPQRVLRGCSR